MSIKTALEQVVDRNHVYPFLMPKQAPSLDVSHNVLLYLEGISVSFDGFKAINDLNLYINDGELRCIIGPNGAGKTTMMDIITGKTKPDTGSAWFGQTINLLEMDEPAIAQAGIGRKFQKPTIFEELTVWQNLELAMPEERNVWSILNAALSSEQSSMLLQTIEQIGLHEHATMLAGKLSHGQKQWLEIGMLLMQKPRLLLVDEPVAGMTHQEMDKTAELLISLSARHSVVVVEHDMDFVRNLAGKDRTVTVLHQGSVLSEGTMDKVQQDRKVIEVYLGE